VLILVFGNRSHEKDSAALDAVPLLSERFPDIEFREVDAVEELEDFGEDLVILDTVLGIDSPRIFEGLDVFSLSPTYSVHDFDLPIYLKLLKKLGRLKNVTIIGVPANRKPETGNMKFLAELESLILKIKERAR